MAGEVNLGGFAGARPKTPHYWQPGAYPYTEDWYPDLIASSGTAMLDEQYLDLDYLDEMVALGVAAGSFVRYGVRTAPFGTDNVDPRNTDDDVAEMAFREARMEAVKAALDAEDLTLSLIYADTEIWPASAAPADNPDRAAWFTARTAKFQSYLDMCESVFPGVPVMWYSRSARFAQRNTSNVLNGQYTFTNYVSIDDPGDFTNAVFRNAESLTACVGELALRGAENTAVAPGNVSAFVWLGQHYQYYTVPGTFTSRTSDSAGVITANATHQIQDGATSCTVTWTSGGGGTRTGVTAAVSGTAITLSGGSGTALPLVGDPVEAMSIARFQNVNESVGDVRAVARWLCTAIRPSFVIFYPGPNLGDNVSPPNSAWWTDYNAWMKAWIAAEQEVLSSAPAVSTSTSPNKFLAVGVNRHG